MYQFCVSSLTYVESLPAFVAGHAMDKLCLPCKLVLPVDACAPTSLTLLRQEVELTKIIQKEACKSIYI